MSANEQEVIDKILLLDRPAKERIFAVLAQDLNSDFDVDAWLHEVREIQQAIALRTGTQAGVSALDLLDELREEAS